MTSKTINRIRRLYESWIGYDPIEDCPTRDPDEILQTLREYRDERWGK